MEAQPAEAERPENVPETEETLEGTEALGLRINLVLSLRSLRGARLRNIIIRILLSLAQIIAFAVILALAAGQTCDQPLRIYLALHLTRITLSLPLSIYAALVPPVPSRRDTAAIIAAHESARRIGSPRLDLRLRKISDLLSLASIVLFILANVWIFSSQCDRTSPLLYYGALSALIISYCYVAEVVFIVLAVVLFLPLVIIAMRMLGFGIGEEKNEFGPIEGKDLAKIPKVVYAPLVPVATLESGVEGKQVVVLSVEEGGVTGEAASEIVESPSTTTEAIYPPSVPAPPSPPTPIPSLTTPPPVPQAHQPISLLRRATRLIYPRKLKKRSNSFIKSLALAGSVGGKNGEYVDLTEGDYVYLPENLSTCSICLCDYEIPPLRNAPVDVEYKPEFLRQLPCKHCFHVECCDSWLAVSGRCPVCQHPVFPPSLKSTV